MGFIYYVANGTGDFETIPTPYLLPDRYSFLFVLCHTIFIAFGDSDMKYAHTTIQD